MGYVQLCSLGQHPVRMWLYLGHPWVQGDPVPPSGHGQCGAPLGTPQPQRGLRVGDIFPPGCCLPPATRLPWGRARGREGRGLLSPPLSFPPPWQRVGGQCPLPGDPSCPSVAPPAHSSTVLMGTGMGTAWLSSPPRAGRSRRATLRTINAPQ